MCAWACAREWVCVNAVAVCFARLLGLRWLPLCSNLPHCNLRVRPRQCPLYAERYAWPVLISCPRSTKTMMLFGGGRFAPGPLGRFTHMLHARPARLPSCCRGVPPSRVVGTGSYWKNCWDKRTRHRGEGRHSFDATLWPYLRFHLLVWGQPALFCTELHSNQFYVIIIVNVL